MGVPEVGFVGQGQESTYRIRFDVFDTCEGFTIANGAVVGPNSITGSTTSATIGGSLTITCDPGYQADGGDLVAECEAGGFTSVGCSLIPSPPPPPSPPP